jgi:hypothetical protein
MITVWFLIALISFPGVPVINYKGYYAYHSKEECEMQKISLENFIVDRELRKGKTAMFVNSYCLEMQAFLDQLKKYEKEKQKGIKLEGQQLGV